MPFTIPHVIPAVYTPVPGTSTPTSDKDTGGYDIAIGGFGFRLATDQQNYYSRATEPTTVHRFDDSLEPGEQSLSPLPWIKSQSSFHGGAGQLNLEQGFVAFQYQAEQVEHVRYDTSLGVDPWTPGELSRLPATILSSIGTRDFSQFVAGSSGGIDAAVGGGVHTLTSVTWPSGPDSAPTLTDIDLTGAHFGGASNCTVASLATDGGNYYALINLTVVGDLAGVYQLVVKGSLGSATAPTVLYSSTTQLTGCLGWAKARLVGGLGLSLYELDTNPGSIVAISSLAPRYTHPSDGWTWTCFTESPSAILGAGSAGIQSSILNFALDTSGTVPVLGGGDVVAMLPSNEQVTALGVAAGSFLAVGTSKGLRIGTFDSYTGALTLGPLSVNSTASVLGLTSRDRFCYAGYTNQQADGWTGLVRLDLSFVVDAAGRLAYAPDLRPPKTAPTGKGAVTAVSILPVGDRIVFVSTDGIHVESSAPDGSDVGWLRTSRIRYDTLENKLFKYGRIRGNLDTSTITIVGLTPFNGQYSLGTFGFLANGDPGYYSLPPGLHEWIQMEFTLNGTSCVMNSYEVRAYPAPAVQDVITFTVNCFRDEVDRFGLDVTDPQLPRVRWQNVLDLKNAGAEVRYVEFTNQGPTAELVLIDQIEYRSYARPTIDDDFGGYITFRLRKTTP